MAKSAWQNPDNCKGIIVDPDGTAENLRIGAIGTAPQAIADHGLWSETKREVLRTIQPSNLRDHTQHGKVAKTAIDPLDTLGLSGAGQILATLKDRGHIFKYTRSRLQVIQFGLGKLNVPTMLKMAVFAPTPRASVSTATIVNAGLLTSMRQPYRRS